MKTSGRTLVSKYRKTLYNDILLNSPKPMKWVEGFKFKQNMGTETLGWSNGDFWQFSCHHSANQVATSVVINPDRSLFNDWCHLLVCKVNSWSISNTHNLSLFQQKKPRKTCVEFQYGILIKSLKAVQALWLPNNEAIVQISVSDGQFFSTVLKTLFGHFTLGKFISSSDLSQIQILDFVTADQSKKTQKQTNKK